MTKAFDKILQFWKNRIWVKGQKSYAVIFILFILWMLFFDQNRASTLFKVQRSVSSIEESIEFYNSETEKLLKEQRDLDKNKERYARENYLMHKDNEEVFVLHK